MSLNSLSSSAVHSLKELFYDAYAQSPAGEVSVGRAPNCILVPSCQNSDQQGTPLMLSRLHAKLAVTEGHLQLYDCGSVNGTWVNTQQISQNTWKVLHDGDVVTFGGPPDFRQEGVLKPNPWRYVVKDLHEFLATFVPAARQTQQKNKSSAAAEVFRFNGGSSGEGGEGWVPPLSSSCVATAGQGQQQDQTQEVFRFNNQAGTMRLEAVPSVRQENLAPRGERGYLDMQRTSSSEFSLPELSRSHTMLASPKPSFLAAAATAAARPQHRRSASAAHGSSEGSPVASLQHVRQTSNSDEDSPPAVQQEDAQQREAGDVNIIDLTTDDSPAAPSCQRLPQLLRRPTRPSDTRVAVQSMGSSQAAAAGDLRQAADVIAESSPNKRREQETKVDGVLYKRVKAGKYVEVSSPEAVIVEDEAGPSTLPSAVHAPERVAEPIEAKAPEGGALAAMKSEFSCAICQEMLVHCVSMVPCGHMFCGECLAGWLANKRDCPVCRAEATAPPISNSAVDNCTEVLEKQLAPEDLQERLRKKQSWDRNKPSLEQALKAPWSSNSGGVSGSGRRSNRTSSGRGRSSGTAGRDDLMGAVFHMMLGGHGGHFLEEPYPGRLARYQSRAGRAASDTQRREFRVDYAPGRPQTMCSACQSVIASNQLRIRVSEGTITRPRWYHYSCVPQYMWSEMRSSGVENMRGISASDQAQMRTRQHAS